MNKNNRRSFPDNYRALVAAFLLLFISFTATSQVTPYDSTKGRQDVKIYGNNYWGNYRFGGSLVIPVGDTITLAVADSGAVMFYNDGFYGWNGYSWGSLGGVGSTTVVSDSAWMKKGNAGTDTSLDFIGTTDDMPLLFKVNGIWAGYLNTSFIDNNIAFGTDALRYKISGYSNSVFGVGAMTAALEGEANTAIGAYSQSSTTTGSYNSSLGANSLAFNTTGNFNTALGDDNLTNNTTGSYNIGLGWGAGKYNGTNSGRLYITGYDHGNHSNDSLYSIIYGLMKNSTPSTQELFLNAKVKMPYIPSGVGTKALRIDAAGNVISADTAVTTTSLPISSLTAATGTNSIDNGTHTQTWNWNTLAGNAIELKTNSTTAASSQTMLSINMLGANAFAGQPTYGISSVNAHTGTGSTNYGIYSAASGASTNVGGLFHAAGGYAILVPASGGSVGIGTSAPAKILHTVGTVRHATLGTASDDTTTYKPVGIDSNGDLIGMTSWPSGGGGGSGTVNSGTQYRLGYYATTGTAISEAAAITANRALISDANGVPTHATTTATQLGYLSSSTGTTGTTSTNLVFSASPALTGDITITGAGGATFPLAITNNVNGVTGFTVTNSSAGTSAQIQNRLINNAGNFAYYGITNTGYAAYAPLNSGAAFYGANGVPVSIFTQTAQPISIYPNGTLAMSIINGGNVGIGAASPTTKLQVAGRFASQQGANVASAAGAIALGADGNSFEITGTNAITLISNTSWVNGAEVTLLFTSTATLTDGTANSGTNIGMELAGNINFVASAGATVKLILSEIGGTQRWREVSRSVN